jgi:hypothetical protein
MGQSDPGGQHQGGVTFEPFEPMKYRWNLPVGILSQALSAGRPVQCALGRRTGQTQFVME